MWDSKKIRVRFVVMGLTFCKKDNKYMLQRWYWDVWGRNQSRWGIEKPWEEVANQMLRTFRTWVRRKKPDRRKSTGKRIESGRSPAQRKDRKKGCLKNPTEVGQPARGETKLSPGAQQASYTFAFYLKCSRKPLSKTNNLTFCCQFESFPLINVHKPVQLWCFLDIEP
jgi:hypothetical protein